MENRSRDIKVLTFREVDRTSWPDFEALFEGRGGPKACWCMLWRARELAAKHRTSADKKALMRSMVRHRTRVGLLGYLDGAPIGWCSVAPRSTFRPLGGPASACESEDEIWSITCFFAKREFRGRGITRQMIEAAIVHAKANGAKILEAYPVDPSSPSYRFMGFASVFRSIGFQCVGKAGSRRHVMRRDLT